MGKGNNEEKQFIENLDRLLAGKEIEGIEDMSEDYRTAMDFAKKLTEFRTEPSPHFKEQLKQRLLSELTRRQVEAVRRKERRVSFSEFLKNIIPQSPVWRTATATLVVALVAVGVLWRMGIFTQPQVLVSPTLEKEGAAVGRAVEEAAAPPSEEAPVSEEVAAKKEKLLGAPSPGPLEVIELNLTQTVNEIAITLERMELSTSEAIIYAFNVPPNYSLPRDTEHPPPSLRELHAHAEYSIDGGPTIDAGTSEIRFLENGMEHTWNLEPLPEDARELTFTITRLGERQGPWKFTISLHE